MPTVTQFDPPKSIPEVLKWIATQNVPISEMIITGRSGKIVPPLINLRPLYNKITRELSPAEQQRLDMKYPLATFQNIRRVPQQYPIWALRNVRVESWTMSHGRYKKRHNSACCRTGTTCKGYTDIHTDKWVHDQRFICCESGQECSGWHRWQPDGTINDMSTLEEFASQRRPKPQPQYRERHPAQGNSIKTPSRWCAPDRRVVRKLKTHAAHELCEDALRPELEATRAQPAAHPQKGWQRRAYKPMSAKNMRQIKQLKALYQDDWKRHVFWPYCIPPEERSPV
jgi:hypothetical protein